MLEGRRIDEFFSEEFFSTEFWLLWSTIMGSLKQHSAIEFRRYMNRFLYLFPNLYDMKNILRTPYCQRQAFIEPLAAWLRPRGVNFLTGAFVQDIGFAPAPGRITVDRLDFEREGVATSVAVGPEDIVLVTTGSQAADLSAGTMAEPPAPQSGGRSVALWEAPGSGAHGLRQSRRVLRSGESRRLALGHLHGDHDRDRIPRSVTALTGSEPGPAGS